MGSRNEIPREIHLAGRQAVEWTTKYHKSKGYLMWVSTCSVNEQRGRSGMSIPTPHLHISSCLFQLCLKGEEVCAWIHSHPHEKEHLQNQCLPSMGGSVCTDTSSEFGTPLIAIRLGQGYHYTPNVDYGQVVCLGLEGQWIYWTA